MRDAEPFWPAQLTAGAALLLYLTLPHSLIMGPKGLVPAVEGVLLAGLVITTPRRHHHQSSGLRAVVVGLLALVSLTTLVSLICSPGSCSTAATPTATPSCSPAPSSG